VKIRAEGAFGLNKSLEIANHLNSSKSYDGQQKPEKSVKICEPFNPFQTFNIVDFEYSTY
jgi:hypothetical protein